MNSRFQLPSARALISTAGSVAATAMVLRSVTRDFIPIELRRYLSTKLSQFLTTFSNEVTLVIDEFDFDGLNKNQLYYAAELYISTLASPSTKTYRVSLPEKEQKIRVSLGGGFEEISDKFSGFQLKWTVVIKQTNPQARYVPYPNAFHSSMDSEMRFLELTFHKKHKDRVINEYLPYVLERSKSVGEEKKTLKLHTLKGDRSYGAGIKWKAVNLDHPANFDTLAMDAEIKNMIVEDLDRFVKRKEFYREVGKAWKRGYLLFGPPGTGKSSLIAAMANYLNFDVYDLELTAITCNSDLRELLISTANRSILVVEDIDASIDLSERKNKAANAPMEMGMGMVMYADRIPKVTLSGLLNFIDGLWSSCGDERIIIFTTNHIEKLDPALLRPGRMDVHIHMSYCTPFGFKMLARNYLGITEHPLILEAEQLIASSQVTPAEIGEQLLKSDEAEVALEGLVKFLVQKKAEKHGNRTENVVLEFNSDEEGVDEWRSGDSSSFGGLRGLMKMGNMEASNAEIMVSNKNEVASASNVLNGVFEEGSGSGSGSRNTKESDRF